MSVSRKVLETCRSLKDEKLLTKKSSVSVTEVCCKVLQLTVVCVKEFDVSLNYESQQCFQFLVVIMIILLLNFFPRRSSKIVVLEFRL